MHSEFANQLRTIVSKKKRRYRKNGYNLDLCYITDRVIAMGFPADNIEAIYRNCIDDVSSFLNSRHGSHYKIYNLCRERSFDALKFSGDIARYPFDDHNPPAFTVLDACINNIAEFLNQSAENVVAINCKAGKGRTGVIVCCTLMKIGVSKDAHLALKEYGMIRTKNGKGVTIPSQIRYIHYYDFFMKNGLVYEPTALWLRLVKFETIPDLGNVDVEFSITLQESATRAFCSRSYRMSRSSRCAIFYESPSHPFYDDLKFEFFYKPLIASSKDLCHCWLNTFFVVNQPSTHLTDSNSLASRKQYCLNDRFRCNTNDSTPGLESKTNAQTDTSDESIYKVTLTKMEIDVANKDSKCKVFPANFAITFVFSDRPVNSKGNASSKYNRSLSKDDFDSMIPQLEDLWKKTSSQFYTSLN